MKMERALRIGKLMQQRCQAKTRNGNRLRLRALIVRIAVADLFAAVVELRLICMRSRVLQLADDQAGAFLADCVTGRKIKQEEQQIRKPSQPEPR